MSDPVESVRIESLGAGGDGIAHLADGRVVFVPETAPGDLVELAQLELSSRLARARVGRILEPSVDRCAPRCRHAGTCGGCTWQHVAYEAQLRAKADIVRDALRRIAGLADTPPVEIVPSPSPYGYRARARLIQSGAGFGYRKRGSHDVEVASECPILLPQAAAALERLNAGDETRTDKREWEILCGSVGEPLVAQIETRRSHGRAAKKKKSSGKVRIEMLGETLEASAGSFVQGNALLWDRLASEVREQCLAQSDENSEPASASANSASAEPKADRLRLVELYAGIGFLTLPLARAGFSGALFESSRTAVQDLRANLRAASVEDRFEVVAGPVEKRKDWPTRFKAADVLLVDPPRTGLESSLCEAIAASGPARIVYVSCDPATLARDVKLLVRAGYALQSVKALDLFPQTPHVETVVRLERRR